MDCEPKLVWGRLYVVSPKCLAYSTFNKDPWLGRPEQFCILEPWVGWLGPEQLGPCLTWDSRTHPKDIVGIELRVSQRSCWYFSYSKFQIFITILYKAIYQSMSKVRIIYYTQFYCHIVFWISLNLKNEITLHHLILNNENHLYEKVFTGRENKCWFLPNVQLLTL